jgi:hypothetical protein
MSSRRDITCRVINVGILFMAAMCGTASLVSHPAAAGGVLTNLRTVGLTGQLPPPSAADGFVAFGDRPVVDSRGHVAFLAVAADDTATFSSVWIEGEQGLRLVASAGSVAADTGGQFESFADLVATDEGVVAFKALLQGAAINAGTRESLWLDEAGALSLIAQAGGRAPHPSADLRFERFETPIALNGDGQASFFSRTRDKENEAVHGSGLWIADKSGSNAAATAGGLGLSDDVQVTFSAQSFEAPFGADAVVNAKGVTLFRGFVEGAGVNDANSMGLWSYGASAGLQLLVRAGDGTPGAAGGKFVSFPSIPTINSAGDTAFLAFASGAQPGEDGAGIGAAEEMSLGVYVRSAAGDVSRVLAIGDPAQGIGGDVHVIDVFDPIMNRSGEIAFLAAVGGEGVGAFNETGLWSNAMSPDGALRLVARQGDAAPGGDSEFVFGVFLEPSLNARGQTAFMASGYELAGNVIVNAAFGIWGQDRSGVLRQVVRVGQEIELAPNDVKTIAALSFTSEAGGEDGKPRGLNDSGELVFRATFADGSSGIFVSNVLAIPEPDSLVIACLGLFACGCVIGRASR